MNSIVTTSASPFHFGHLDLYNNAVKVFGKRNVNIVIGKNINKIMDIEQIKYHLVPYKINYIIAENITFLNFCKTNKIKYLIRGIRNENDAKYELELNLKNCKSVKTVFFPSNPIFSDITSSYIKKLLKNENFDTAKKYMNEDSMYRFFYKKPKFVVFFGDRYIGKSYYLKKIFNDYNIVDVDKILCYIFEILYDKELCNYFRDMIIKHNNNNELEKLIEKYMTRNYWNKFFNYIENNYEKYDLCYYIKIKNVDNVFILDFSCISIYWNYIPSYLKGYLYLIKLCNTKSENCSNKIDKKKNLLYSDMMENIENE